MESSTNASATAGSPHVGTAAPLAAPVDAVTTAAFRDGRLVAPSFGVDDVVEQAAAGATVWVDLQVPAATEHLHRLGTDLGLSPLVIEDVLGRHERVRVDRHDGYVFVNTYAARVEPATGQVRTDEVSAILLPRVLVTVRRPSALDGRALLDRWQEYPELVRHGSVALLYGLLDLVVDGHFAAVRCLDDEAEAVEDLLFEERSQREVQERTYRLRKSLVVLRRAALPMRDVVAVLLRHDPDDVDSSLRPYFEDLYDHVLRVAEWSESLRDLVTALFETSLSVQDHRLNLVIKKLTAWAAIIAVPTAITGFFGQNVQFPGEGTWGGGALSLLLIAASATALFALFRARDWI